MLLTHGSEALPPCTAIVVANVVALDQVLVWNKFGSRDPWGMISALRCDVVAQGGGSALEPGNVRLRCNLRPRPLTLRVNVGDDPEDAGEKAHNYRTEPFWARLGGAFMTPEEMNDEDLSDVLKGNIETPLFTVPAGQRVMFRLAKVAGRARAGTFTIHGHRWRDMYSNNLSSVMGQQTANTVGSNWNLLLLDGAGGPNAIRGDFLFHEVSSPQFSQGLWGILRAQ